MPSPRYHEEIKARRIRENEIKWKGNSLTRGGREGKNEEGGDGAYNDNNGRNERRKD